MGKGVVKTIKEAMLTFCWGVVSVAVYGAPFFEVVV